MATASAREEINGEFHVTA